MIIKYIRQISDISGNSLPKYIMILLVVFTFNSLLLQGENKIPSGITTIIIDAGHGGKDPGAVVGSAIEKDIVLDIALRLGKIIKRNLPDVKVIYTRRGDYFVPLFQRSVIANNNNANLFISIHANYCSAPSVKGTETYVLGLHRTQDNLDVAKKENSVILLEEDYTTRYEGFDPNLSESYIIFDMIQSNHFDQSVMFASMVQDLFRQQARRADRDVRQAGFLVLRETAMPSVLIETGYLSNKSEAAYLMTENGRETIASSIFRSLKNYKSKIESRLNLATGERNVKPRKTEISKKIIPDKAPVGKEIKKNQKGIESPKTITEEIKSVKNGSVEEVKPLKGNAVDEVESLKKSTVEEDMALKNNTNEEEEVKPLTGNTMDEVEPLKKSTVEEIKEIKNSPIAEVKPLKKNTAKEDEPLKKNTLKEVKSLKNSDIEEVKPLKKNAVEETANEYAFAVQICASKVKLPLTSKIFKGIEGIKNIQVGEYYKYICSESKSLAKTNQSLLLIREKVKDAFITGLKNGQPVPLKEALNHK